MGISSKKQTIGYWYLATMHIGVALSMDELYKINASDITIWSGSIKQTGSTYINAAKAFGGEKSEGGIEGTLDVLLGDDNQQQHPLLVRLFGHLIPAFRGFVSLVFDGKLAAMNPYPKAWEIFYRRALNGWPNNTPWYPEKCVIWLLDKQIYSMNPAHILYESYVSDTWGSGLPVSKMDDAAWKKAADTLYDEGFGLCTEYKMTDDLGSFRDVIRNHANAQIDTDSLTGLITIRLIRDDYNINDLPVFDEDNGLISIELDAANVTDVPSQVIVKYVDAITFETRATIANNLAVAMSQFGRNVETIEYLALPTGELANRVAYRDLKSKTSALKRVNLKLTRVAAEIVKGQPFRIRTLYRDNNIDIVVRAERREDHFMTDGTIDIVALQDVFGLPKIPYNPTPPIYPPMDTTPVVIVVSCVMEAPYGILAAMIDPANFQLLDASDTFLMAAAGKPNQVSRSYDIASRIGTSGDYEISDYTGTFCPVATISEDLGYTTTTFSISDYYALEDVEIGTAAAIGDEIVRVDKIDLVNNTVTVGRGCFDTVPAKHNQGAAIIFFDTYESSDYISYTAGLNVNAKLLTNTATGQLSSNDAPINTIAMKGRQGLPYAPGDLKINNIAYPEVIRENDIVISWAHRNKVLQADQLVDTTAGSVILDSGVTYNLKIYVDDILTVNKSNFTEDNYSLTVDLDDVGDLKDVVLMHFDDDITDDSSLIWQKNGAPVFVDGKIGSKAISFNESSFYDYLVLPKNDDLDFKLGNFTIECWVKISKTPTSYGVIICSDNRSFGGSSTFLMYKTELASPYYQQNKFVFGVGDTSIASTTIPVRGEWYHVAITRKDKIVSMFINGVKEVSLKFEQNINFALDGTYLGRSYYSGDNGFFKGCIDELRIANWCMHEDNFTPSLLPYTYNSGVKGKAKVNIVLDSVKNGLNSYQGYDYTFKVSV